MNNLILKIFSGAVAFLLISANSNAVTESYCTLLVKNQFPDVREVKISKPLPYLFRSTKYEVLGVIGKDSGVTANLVEDSNGEIFTFFNINSLIQESRIRASKSNCSFTQSDVLLSLMSEYNRFTGRQHLSCKTGEDFKMIGGAFVTLVGLGYVLEDKNMLGDVSQLTPEAILRKISPPTVSMVSDGSACYTAYYYDEGRALGYIELLIKSSGFVALREYRALKEYKLRH